MISTIESIKLPNLLIVDDEVNVTRSLARSLRDQFMVYTANSAKEALEIIHQNEIEVVLTDQRMPDMTGVELLKEIRKINPQINGIMLSGYSDTPALIEALNIGSVRGFIPKPWDINTLKQKLHETVTIFESLVTEDAGTQGQSASINQQNLNDLKNLLGLINNLDNGIASSSELKELVKNPYSENMSEHDYLNQLLDGFALVKSGGRFTFCNPAFRRLLNISKNTQKESLGADDLKEYADLYEAVQLGLTGEYTHFDSKLTSTPGKSIYSEVSVTPFLDKSNQYHIVIVIHDQTEKEKTISYLKGMNHVAFALNNYREFDEGLELVLRTCLDIFNVNAVAFYTLDPDEQSLTYGKSVGLEESAIGFLKNKKDLFKLPVEDQASQNTNSPTVWDGNKGRMPIFPDLVNHQPIQSAVFAFIHEQDRIVGLLALYDHSARSFDEDLLLLSAICNQIGTARVNARLQGELQQQARMDGLTGLMNRRHFFEKANRNYIRGKFKQIPLAIFMLDADHFKPINDHYGHLVGDQALKAIANVLDKSFRPGDLVCRYGGDEFACLVLDCDQHLAEKITKRMLANFASYRLPVGDGFIQLGVSIGFAIANYNEAETIEGRLNQADTQMYLSKQKKKQSGDEH